jgi:hypothetical protein
MPGQGHLALRDDLGRRCGRCLSKSRRRGRQDAKELPRRTVPRPWREETPEALPYPILRGLSRPRRTLLRATLPHCHGVLGLQPSPRHGQLHAKNATFVQESSPLPGFALSQTAVFSPSVYPQIPSGGRRPSALLQSVDHAPGRLRLQPGWRRPSPHATGAGRARSAWAVTARPET